MTAIQMLKSVLESIDFEVPSAFVDNPGQKAAYLAGARAGYSQGKIDQDKEHVGITATKEEAE